MTASKFSPISRPPMMHELKCARAPLQAILKRDKRFEYRKADRDFRVGDYLFLTEVIDTGGAGYGRALVIVDYILHGPDFGIPEGYCIMTITLATRE